MKSLTPFAQCERRSLTRTQGNRLLIFLAIIGYLNISGKKAEATETPSDIGQPTEPGNHEIVGTVTRAVNTDSSDSANKSDHERTTATMPQLKPQPTVWEESNHSYHVRFTNPTCRSYKYDPAILANDGTQLREKPKNVFCTPRDALRSGRRVDSPQSEILQMINSPKTKEIFLTFLSYSNKSIHKALCSASKERHVKITMIVDNAERGPGRKNKKAISRKLKSARKLAQCTYQDTDDVLLGPRIIQRGHKSGLGYAHNKLIITNPASESISLAYGSANLSSGVVLHHENWHFVTIPSNTFFAQIHLCLMNGMLHHGDSKKAYASYLSSCRKNILDEQHLKEEADVKTFFVPGAREENGENIEEGALGLSLLVSQIKNSDMIDIAAHRIKQKAVFNLIANRTRNGALSRSRMVVDDDIYWSGTKRAGGFRMPNTPDEYGIARSMTRKGVKFGYMETNHAYYLLHHNKYMIFYRQGKAHGVWAGAGNFTKAAFTKNYENFYYITIPKITDAFAQQFEDVFKNLATPIERLPVENRLPPKGLRRR